MGFLAEVAGPLLSLLSSSSAPVLVLSGIASFVVLAIVLNVLRQLLFKNSQEPPVVFHWVPFIGNTISYGIDPFIFFFKCREKVHNPSAMHRVLLILSLVWRRIHIHPARQKDDGMLGHKRKRVYTQRQVERCQCRRNLHPFDDTRIRQGRCV